MNQTGRRTGWKLVIDEDPQFRCGYCGSPDVEYRTWRRDGFDDREYRCNRCTMDWWVEEDR